jgi:cyclophilin family peptidyl-prolyl cis-trans isomerase
MLDTIEGLQEEFVAAQKADEKAKQKEIGEKFQKLVTEFQTDIMPNMLKLADEVNRLDPSDTTAAELVAGRAFSENRFADVVAVVDKLGDKASPMLQGIGGVSLFATQDFAGAQAMLEKVRKADPELFEQLGAQYLRSCPEYIEYWKTEQAIRAKEAQADDLPRVLLKTTKGEIVIELFENEAPNTVANFISLVEQKKYDGIKFHRVIPTFMAQGGDPNTLDDDPSNDGMGGPGYHIACECYRKDARKHFQGSLSMAHAGKDTGGSQFFLTHLPTAHLNANAEQQRGHTVFGRVIKGLDVALSLKKGDIIKSATVLRKRDHKYEPVKIAENEKPATPRLKLKGRTPTGSN